MENGVVLETELKHEPSGCLDPNSNGSSLFQRRIEFHLARKPFKGFSNGRSDFQLETLNPGSENQKPGSNMVHSNGGGKKKQEWSDSLDIALDPELNFGFTLRKIGAGLENLGNTCFLNSVLQCLTYTEPLAAYLQSGKHQNSCRIAGFCALCAIQKHVSCALQSSGRILAPKDLVSNLRCISRSFRNARQEDAHEYMVNLLESMHKCCLPSGVPSESPGAYEKSLVHKIFGGQLRSQVKCLQCSYCSNTFDPFLDLSLEIVKADSLYKALRNFTAAEQLDGGEREYHCQQCKQKVRALKQLTVHKAPYVLTIHLKRFRAHNPGQKIDKKVQFEPTLDLKPFVSGSYEGGLRYTLYGVLVHYGWSTHSGHYYCFVRTSSGMWYSLDDNRVFQVSEKTVLEQKAYMLFYVRDRGSFFPRKSLDVAQKENLKTNVSGNTACLNMSSTLKESLQSTVKENGLNSAVKENGSNSAHSPTLLQKGTLDSGSVKGNTVGEASTSKGSGSIIKADALTKGDPLVQSSSKEPTTKETLKDCSVSTSDKPKFLPSSVSSATVSGCIEHDLKKERVTAENIDVGKAVGTQRNSDVSIKSVNCNKPQDSAFEKVSTNGTTQKSKRIISATVISNSLYVKAGVGSQISVTESVELTDPQNMSNVSVYVKSSDAARCKRFKKKFLNAQTISLRLGTSILRASMGIWKKKKFKRSKRCTPNAKSLLSESMLDNDAFSFDWGPSTSGKTGSISLDATHSKGKGVKSCSKREAKRIVEKEARKKGSLGREFQVNHSEAPVPTDGPGQKGSCSSIERKSNVRETNSAKDCSRDGMQNGFLGKHNRGLEESLETIVSRWDDIDLPSPQVAELESVENISIGYVPDEWNEEYDRGKRKKLRTKQGFGGPNLFQEIANRKSQLRMAKVGHSDSANQPFRI